MAEASEENEILNNWAPCAIQTQCPKTITQIHRDAKNEQEMLQLKLATTPTPPVKHSGRGGPNRMGNRVGHHEDGWTKVQTLKPTRFDPSKMKLLKANVDERKATLGPSKGFGIDQIEGWMRKRLHYYGNNSKVDSLDLSSEETNGEQSKGLCAKMKDILDGLKEPSIKSQAKKVVALKVTSTQNVSTIINLIFDKAVEVPPLLQKRLAELCLYITVLSTSADMTAEPDQWSAFRKLLAQKCQEQIELCGQNTIVQMDEAATSLNLKKVTQIILFVGELFSFCVVPENLVHGCINILLSNEGNSDDCLMQLLGIVSEDLEHSETRALCSKILGKTDQAARGIFGNNSSRSFDRDRSTKKSSRVHQPSIHFRRYQSKPMIIPKKVDKEVELKRSKNAWKPFSKQLKLLTKLSTEELEILTIERDVRVILNKVTPSTFKELMQQVLALKIDTEKKLRKTIDLIFEKAIDEPIFSEAYANMCRQMTQIRVTPEVNPDQPNPSSQVEFRKLLLTKCQREFERDKSDWEHFQELKKKMEENTDPEQAPQLKEEYETAEFMDRRRTLGNIRFIGELFKLRMLTEPIMHSCIMTLFKAKDDDHLESLCRLLTTIGKDIDTPKAKNNWVPRAIQTQGPKTITQIHRDAKNEQKILQLKLAMTHTPPVKHMPTTAKSERKLIKIVDPSTNQDIADDSMRSQKRDSVSTPPS